MARVIFIEGTRDYRQKRVTLGWYLVWILAAAIVVVLITNPSYMVIPPWVHNLKVSLDN